MCARLQDTTNFVNGIILQLHDESVPYVHIRYADRLPHGRFWPGNRQLLYKAHYSCLLKECVAA
jgi:hypothetical protein